MMRALFLLFVTMAMVAPVPISGGQDTSAGPTYLRWTAAEAERIGKSARVTGRVGYNYKLRATWLTSDVIQATVRWLQISERLTDIETEALVQEATAAGEVVLLVEIDPREGSGVIPTDWSAFLGPAGNGTDVARGVNTPALETVRALRGVHRRDYSYEQFWVVFPRETASGDPLFPKGATQAALTVRIAGKEGRVSFPIPTHLRSE
jgi:hypothetical protein